jgi:hypothetical protein
MSLKVEGQPNLVQVLDKEADAFQKLDNVWRPNNLFFQIQTQELLRDMNRRFVNMKANEGELKKLERASIYQTQLRRLELILRRAKFVRLSNQLAFGQAVSDFYTHYGQILRFLRIDQARGKLQSA